MTPAQTIHQIITGAQQVAGFVAQNGAATPQQAQTMQAVQAELQALLTAFSR